MDNYYYIWCQNDTFATGTICENAWFKRSVVYTFSLAYLYYGTKR